uniref:Glycerophosphocholine acyltransferase 1 n=1 Tax=viral metagenome TaxID=1070528 RepID=A0A6C0H583_9ZZZZ
MIIIINIFIVLSVIYLMTYKPHNFEFYYLYLMSTILTIIFYNFIKRKYQFFMFDFCYFTILFTLFNIYYKNEILSNILYTHSTGMLSSAIIIWNNKFILTKMNKMTSLYIHLLPNIYYYCQQNTPSKLNYSYSILFYLSWQIFYVVITEIFFKNTLNKNYMTSFKYMKDIYFPNNNNITWLKILFVTLQFIIMLFCLLIPSIIINSKLNHLYYICILFLISCYNGMK